VGCPAPMSLQPDWIAEIKAEINCSTIGARSGYPTKKHHP
jgi:hypothetical protein